MVNCLLSVIIPCHNYGQYLTEAIESVLRQDGLVHNAEVIVINDHSSDPNTLQTLSHWESADPRVRVIHNTSRSGAAAARNLGITAATGEWIGFLDADDVWTPGGLQARWQVVRTHPEAQWIGADFIRWHEDGTFDEEGFFKTRSLTHQLLCRAYESGTVLKLLKPVNDFLQVSLGWTSTIMVKKALLLSVGGFETSLGNYEDHHLWIRLARRADFFFVPAVVALYRQHAASVSREDVPPAYWYIVAMRLLLRDPHFRPQRTLIRRKLAALFEQNVYYHRARGETRLAMAAATQAVLHHPSGMDCWKNLLAVLVRRR
jgi:glycosyltransferase involved in cell wall biosynthesis